MDQHDGTHDYRRTKGMRLNEYMLTDDQGNEYSYEASDMQMALVVHQQIVGTNVQKGEQI